MAASSHWLNSRQITRCMDAMREEQYRARAEEVLARYFFEPLAERLRRGTSGPGKTDAEDAALHALNYALERLRVEDAEAFSSRASLLALLTVVGKNKLRNIARAQAARKRGGDQVVNESELSKGDEEALLTHVPDSGPPPDELVAAAEESERLLKLLNDELCQIALWKIEGYRNREIAERLGCVETTIERKLQRIRAILTAES